MQGDWNALGEVLYRKWHVYDMGWGEKMQIDDYIVCGAPFGGPLATIRDDKRLQYLPSDGTKTKIRIYTSSGRKIAEVSVI
jgi:vacuolar protein sorting-associated protein 16